MNREVIFKSVVRERNRQDQIHPADPVTFNQLATAILGEEVGEVNKAWLEADSDGLKTELIQVMAVCCRWLELL